MNPIALLTGITGQDGSYLAELLLEKGYTVYGLVRRSSSANTDRIDHLLRDVHEKGVKLFRVYGDLSDSDSLVRAIRKIRAESGSTPQEIYNLAAQSHVGISFDNPIYTSDVSGLGAIRMLESIRELCPEARFYQASSSEMFGDVKETPQNEKTPFNPVSPYACAKVFAHNATKMYRQGYGMHASNGILFNHESERRGINFVTRKITRGLSRVKFGLEESLFLGNLEARRDWGHTRDYVQAMWLMLQQDRPEDYVIGTGENHTIREFLELSAKYIGITMQSNNQQGTDERYYNENGKMIVGIDRRFLRPLEVNTLLADSRKARELLGWQPQISFDRLTKTMCEHDMDLAEKEAFLRDRRKS